jgi:hypothetical protein
MRSYSPSPTGSVLLRQDPARPDDEPEFGHLAWFAWRR